MSMHVGLIGAGNISDTHARAAAAIPGVEIVAVQGGNPRKTEALAARYGAAVYADVAALVRHRPLDLVIIGSPSGLHAAQGILAAEQGLHVLTEKPIDVSLEAADRLIAAADAAGVRLGVLFQDRGQPDFVRARQSIADGAMGRPLLVSARVKWYRAPEYYAQSRWRGTRALDGGGAVINQGIHTVDLLLWLLGPVSGVTARTATALHSIDVEDTALALLEFESGAVGSYEATTAAYPGYQRRVEISGTEGTLVLEHDRLVAADLRHPRPDLLGSSADDANASSSSPVVSDARAHQRLIADFIDAIRDGRDPICSGRAARASLAVVDAIYRSARDGVWTAPRGPAAAV